MEIFVIYEEYINKEVYKRIKAIVRNKSCEISNVIKDEINILFNKLPKRILNNLPDRYYHKRHNMLICSNIKTIGNASILLLKSIYGNAENFENKNKNNNDKNVCLGKRNGVSGCRNCCKKHSSGNYSSCVDFFSSLISYCIILFSTNSHIFSILFKCDNNLNTRLKLIENFDFKTSGLPLSISLY